MADIPVIQLRNVGMWFGRQQVLSGIDLSVAANESVAVIGESGCGKTVLLKLIVGLLQPTEGEVLFEGTPLQSLPAHELTQLRLRVGFLFQQSALFDSLNVFDNVAFGLRAKGGVSHAEVARRVRERLHDVGLPAAVEAKMPAELSGGMRKRVGIARALALDPDVMLYDEPTTGLDPIMTDVINELILQTRRKRPVTGIIVSHEMRTVRKCAQRAVMFFPFSRLAPVNRKSSLTAPQNG